MTDLKKLRELAEAATPGPWEASGNLPFYATLKKPARSLSKHDDKRPDYWRVQDVEFVLAANPETVIALLDRIKELEARNLKLDLLEEFGVDNWEGYSDAMDVFDREVNHE